MPTSESAICSHVKDARPRLGRELLGVVVLRRLRAPTRSDLTGPICANALRTPERVRALLGSRVVAAGSFGRDRSANSALDLGYRRPGDLGDLTGMPDVQADQRPTYAMNPDVEPYLARMEWLHTTCSSTRISGGIHPLDVERSRIS